MSDSDRELEAEIQIEEDISDSFNDKEGSDRESDGEGDIVIEICEGSTSYKKVKMDENGKSKRRNRTDCDNASDTMDSEPSHSSQGEKDSQALTDLVKQIRKKKKNKIKEDKGKNSKENSGSKEKKKKSKKKGEKEKNTNKKKLNDIADKTAIEQDKKKQKEREKEKTLEEYQNKFKEFERKYPKYIYKDKIKFPIDDKLFILYPTLLDKYVPKTKKPVPKNTLIPANELGDMLQIWDLFHSYKELFSLKNLEQEEIYACLKYQGNEHLYLVDYLHQEILIFIITDFFESYRFEQIKDAMDNPFFVLIKYYVGYENAQSKELMLIWPEFLKRLVEIQPYTDYLGPTAKKYIESIAKLTTLNYHKADYKVKVRVLLEVMNLAYETDTLRYYVNVRLDKFNALFYDKANLLSEIRSEQQECAELKAKIEAVEKKQKDLEAKGEQEILQPEDIQNQIAIEAEIKGLEQIQKSITKLQTSIEEKQNHVKDINNSPNFQLKTSTRLGLDSNKSEYWIFKGHPERLYVKMTPFLYSEDNWCYYDEKEELDGLLGGLNVKGVQEKDLSEKLKKAISKGELALKSRNQENKDSSDAVAKITEEFIKQQDLNFWFAKVHDYSLLVDQSKEENKPQKNDQDDDEEELSIKIQQRKSYDTKYLTIEGIKEILCITEEKLTLYLEKWNGRWADQEIRDDLKRRVREAQDVTQLKHILRELDQHFEFAEIPARQKGLDNHDEDDHSDDDEENTEEDSHESEPKPPHRSRICVEESNKAENTNEEKFRKMRLIIWDRSNERIKLCWDAFLTEVNNITSLFLTTSIFNQFVETYVDKKTAKYFTEYTNIVEYFLAKRARKRSETVNRLRGNRQTQDKPMEKLRQDRELRKRTYNFREQDSESDTSQSPPQESESKNTNASQRHKQNGDMARDRGRKTRKARAVDNEESRKEFDEEAELHYLRRSTRNVRKIRMIEESEDEEEDEEEEEYKGDEETEKNCCICQQSGELVKCTICQNSFHSACVGLKSLPTDKWTCFTCLQKLASQRHTRSTTRKLH